MEGTTYARLPAAELQDGSSSSMRSKVEVPHVKGFAVKPPSTSNKPTETSRRFRYVSTPVETYDSTGESMV
ncbi:hypothetical protein TWF696_001306 [Orbilia brochopaga]|uniref:Uncharacterized protein n=1 Tax=Orbilia brochopaga TaxID=3140254 RepID=A0AAV9U884_9PEZI